MFLRLLFKEGVGERGRGGVGGARACVCARAHVCARACVNMCVFVCVRGMVSKGDWNV